AGDGSIAVRMKDSFDGAEMAGNSIAAWNLQALGTLLDRKDFREHARRTLDYFTRRLGDGAAGMPQMLVAMDLERSTVRHVVVAGGADAATIALAACLVLAPAARARLAGGLQAPQAESLVHVSAALVRIPMGGTAIAAVEITVQAGWHVNANPPSPDYMIPTDVTVEA